jgi:hypothetical protein
MQEEEVAPQRPRLVQAVASATRWQSFLGEEHNPFSARVLLPSRLGGAWNSGRHAPVSLTLSFDAPVAVLELCPSMLPDGHVSLVVVPLEDAGERTAHSAVWRDCVWVSIALAAPSRSMRLEFAESPSWVALHGLSAR